MTFDPLRCAEATCQAAVVLGATLVPAAWPALDGRLAAVLAGMFLVITAAIYALHAVTFDFFRLTGHRDRQIFPAGSRDE
ncbi:hypothetical protein JIG36_44800 [Actinoplanes sp. LDG1-06]|uniref:Uncharacterized protein n=1 Tax=Paractinoplanes ovalisporus TaxID=2810368 RepID=A0ABS2AS37_9ACTN|nr:hypothetical protein [Actinoplanes ovalisporus]MBM2622644.1 hypothetical protein [Actinoplanes ovalisporus]